MDSYLKNFEYEFLNEDYMKDINSTFTEFMYELSKLDNDLDKKYLKPLTYPIDYIDYFLD